MHSERLRFEVFGSPGKGQNAGCISNTRPLTRQAETLCVTHFILTCEGLQQRLAAAEVAEQEGIRVWGVGGALKTHLYVLHTGRVLWKRVAVVFIGSRSGGRP